jgi:DNA-binding MarR family transcriptional regulator
MCASYTVPMIADADDSMARWRADRPALDTETLDLTARVIRLARHFELGRRQALAARELEVWEFDVLAALRSAGAPHQLSPSDLMAMTLSASGTITNRIDRLAARGFVTRHTDQADRRGVVVKLTPAGRRRVDAAASAIAEAESGAWAAISGRRRDQLTAVLRDVQGTVTGT